MKLSAQAAGRRQGCRRYAIGRTLCARSGTDPRLEAGSRVADEQLRAAPGAGHDFAQQCRSALARVCSCDTMPCPDNGTVEPLDGEESSVCEECTAAASAAHYCAECGEFLCTGIALRLRSAMSGTDIGYSNVLWLPSAMSGTEIGSQSA
eukprot:2356956-Rhodomonas_salina.2